MSNSLLSYEELLALAARGVIKDVSLDQVNGASIDITLGRKILYEGQPDDFHFDQTISLIRREPLPTETWDMREKGAFILQPGQFILAQSRETFYLPDDIAAEYKLKSSMARIGLNHATAGWCDPHWHGSVLTLELKNWTQHHYIELNEGDKIGQMIFFHCRPVPKDKGYAARGRYNGDQEVMGIKK